MLGEWENIVSTYNVWYSSAKLIIIDYGGVIRPLMHDEHEHSSVHCINN